MACGERETSGHLTCVDPPLPLVQIHTRPSFHFLLHPSRISNIYPYSNLKTRQSSANLKLASLLCFPPLGSVTRFENLAPPSSMDVRMNESRSHYRVYIRVATSSVLVSVTASSRAVRGQRPSSLDRNTLHSRSCTTHWHRPVARLDSSLPVPPRAFPTRAWYCIRRIGDTPCATFSLLPLSALQSRPASSNVRRAACHRKHPRWTSSGRCGQCQISFSNRGGSQRCPKCWAAARRGW